MCQTQQKSGLRFIYYALLLLSVLYRQFISFSSIHFSLFISFLVHFFFVSSFYFIWFISFPFISFHLLIFSPVSSFHFRQFISFQLVHFISVQINSAKVSSIQSISSQFRSARLNFFSLFTILSLTAPFFLSLSHAHLHTYKHINCISLDIIFQECKIVSFAEGHT